MEKKKVCQNKNTQPVTSGAVSTAIGVAVDNDGLLSNLTEIVSNTYILYPTNYREYTMPKTGIATLIMQRNTEGFTCYIARNGTAIEKIDNWTQNGGSWAIQFKVKQNDIIRISQNSMDDNTRWLIGNFYVSY